MKYLSSIVITSLFFISSASYADSCEQAAYFYNKGQYNSAKTILQPLLNKGEACAEYYMGMMYLEGKGVKANEKKAIKLFRSAEKKGDVKAKSMMDSYH